MIDFRQVLAQKGKIDEIVDQMSGEIIGLPKGAIITAIDPITIALPKELLDGDVTFGSVFDCDDDTEVGFQPGSRLVFIMLSSGKSLLIKRSSQSIFYAPQNDLENVSDEEDKISTAKIPRKVMKGKLDNDIKKALKVRVRWKKIE